MPSDNETSTTTVNIDPQSNHTVRITVNYGTESHVFTVPSEPLVPLKPYRGEPAVELHP